MQPLALAFTPALVFLLLGPLPPQDSKPAEACGYWQGTLVVGPQKLRLVVHLERKDGDLTGTMDSLDQVRSASRSRRWRSTATTCASSSSRSAAPSWASSKTAARRSLGR